MRRRRLLDVGAALALAAVAGCIGEERPPSGPRTPPQTPREEEISGEETDAPADRTDDDENSPDDETETTEPPGDLRVESVDFEESTDGELLVTVVVENVAEEERSGRVRVRVVADGEEFTISSAVTVPGQGTTEHRVEPGIDYDRFAAEGIVDAQVSSEE